MAVIPHEDNVPDLSNNYKIIKPKKMYNRGNIMSENERLEIRNWAIDLLFNNKMDELTNERLELKLNDDSNSDIIPLVFEIRKRIEQKECMESFEREKYVNDFVTIISKTGFIHKHTDPNDVKRNLFHIRFNVFITIPTKGGTTYYDGHEIDAIEGSYVLCRSGIDEHWSDPNEDIIPRISLSFGYLVPPEKADELCSDTSIGTYTQFYPLTVNMPTNVSVFNTKLPAMNDNILEERGDPGSNIFTALAVINDSQCDFITKYILNHSNLWEKRDIGYESGNNVECNYLTLNSLKCRKIKHSIEIDGFICSVITLLLKKLNHTRPEFVATDDDGYTLRRIYGGTTRHVDGVHSKVSGFTNLIRSLSLIIVLNDDYDGGIFNFPNQNLKLKVKKGEAILFPPYWTHPHSVSSVGEGQSRYTINTWIHEKFA
jgi:hypothetical protein